jgi:AbrB family looped-hinge helix DNA binding protein
MSVAALVFWESWISMEIMKTAIIRQDGVLTIPSAIRKALGLATGTPVVVMVSGSSIVVKPWEPKEERP